MPRPPTARARTGTPFSSTATVPPATSFGRRKRVPIWIAGIFVCLSAALGTAAIVRSIPASYASIPDEGATSTLGAAASRSDEVRADDPRAHGTAARETTNRRNRAWCAECGVVESIRQIRVSGAATAANERTANSYEITVRFRDGATTVFSEASPRNWQLGSRVIVIN